jgi:hypothetical protein
MARLVSIEIALVLLALYFIKRFILSRKRFFEPLPPGPKGLPLVGNINDLAPTGPDGPIEPEYMHWIKHKDLYGPISSVTILGQTMVVIHDKNMASELMDKRANIHSGRPTMKFAFDLYVNN